MKTPYSIAAPEMPPFRVGSLMIGATLCEIGIPLDFHYCEHCSWAAVAPCGDDGLAPFGQWFLPTPGVLIAIRREEPEILASIAQLRKDGAILGMVVRFPGGFTCPACKTNNLDWQRIRRIDGELRGHPGHVIVDEKILASWNARLGNPAEARKVRVFEATCAPKDY